MKRSGRPPLDTRDPSTKVCLAIPSKGYDALYRQASASRVTVPELIRQSLRRQLGYPNLPERKPGR